MISLHPPAGQCEPQHPTRRRTGTRGGSCIASGGSSGRGVCAASLLAPPSIQASCEMQIACVHSQATTTVVDYGDGEGMHFWNAGVWPLPSTGRCTSMPAHGFARASRAAERWPGGSRRRLACRAAGPVSSQRGPRCAGAWLPQRPAERECSPCAAAPPAAVPAALAARAAGVWLVPISGRSIDGSYGQVLEIVAPGQPHSVRTPFCSGVIAFSAFARLRAASLSAFPQHATCYTDRTCPVRQSLSVWLGNTSAPAVPARRATGGCGRRAPCWTWAGWCACSRAARASRRPARGARRAGRSPACPSHWRRVGAPEAHLHAEHTVAALQLRHIRTRGRLLQRSWQPELDLLCDSGALCDREGGTALQQHCVHHAWSGAPSTSHSGRPGLRLTQGCRPSQLAAPVKLAPCVRKSGACALADQAALSSSARLCTPAPAPEGSGWPCRPTP